MSYWVYLTDHYGAAVPVAPHEEGGIYAAGGTDLAQLNVTYNYSAIWNVKRLSGRTASDTIAELEEVVARLGTGRDADYWKPTEGNVGHMASVLLSWARQHPSEEWPRDSNTGVYKTPVAQTIRTQKVPRNHVIAEATKEHPAQVQVYTEDVPVGTWHSTRFSGALPATRVEELTERVESLQKAVKTAREEANMADADPVKVGETILGWLFA